MKIWRMHSVIVNFLLAFLAQALVQERTTNHTTLNEMVVAAEPNDLVKGSLDTLVDVLVDKLIIKLADRFAVSRPRLSARSVLQRPAVFNHRTSDGFHVPMLAKPDNHYPIGNRCIRTSWPLYQQLRRQHGLAPLLAATDDTSAESAVSPEAATVSPDWVDNSDILECTIDTLELCTPSQMEVMYIDALWDYYEKGKTTLSDDQFDQLKMELNWQGSGFPTLRRSEIKFVEAALAYARGQPILNDEEYEKLKNDVKSNGKRREVTSFLLYVKGMQALEPEQFAKLAMEMGEQGIKISPTGAACTLSDTPTTLQSDVLDTIQMYTALGVVPTIITTGSYFLLVLLLQGIQGEIADAAGLSIAGVAGIGLTSILVNYLGLTSPQILKGVCPCCEGELRELTGDFRPKRFDVKCKACKTTVGFNADTLMIEDAGGFKAISDGKLTPKAQQKAQNEWDRFVNNAAWGAVRGQTGGGIIDGVREAAGQRPSNADNLGPGPKVPKKPTPTSKDQVISEGIREGIFAWAILLGYGLFGETFISRVRGKGIAIHSGVINDFAARFAIPVSLKQKYIQTAKRNGHDLGFLVDGAKFFGDGIFGQQAMKWWKSQGF
eukprot:gnl/MRDRNA2_/MRDRNA2_70641_c0_seq1.p1 gnl/MRDRNA2_/MRDRNA2_70641_c0~~gnl/MRDRNA2_/MRDRNA2_70641_c0_seq1.p1  ORF type:complete len:606 (+),score=96.22 gnl/MRDRNA2_/MRDRNA2_70641_c0_seq1:132-1949(+)